MDEIDQSESPSSKTLINNRVTKPEVLGDSDGKESGTRKKSGNSKRKTRNIEKENGDVNSGTNGDVSTSEEQAMEDNVEMREVNGSGTEQNETEKNEQNGVAHEKSDPAEEALMENDIVENKSVNGDVNFDVPSETKGTPPDSEEVNMKESANDSMNVDTEESYITAETGSIPMDRTVGSEQSPKDGSTSDDNALMESDADNGDEPNGGTDAEVKAAEAHEEGEKKNFFGKWSFGSSAEKKEPETNGHTEDISPCQLYYSSIRGRMPLNRGTPKATVDEKDSVIYRKGLKTPNNVRTLDDSFRVKSEPSRTNRGDSKERPNLRKFPAKRCLNSDESDEKNDSFLSNLTFTKRRKLDDDNKTNTGFLRSFLWSPFRKRSISGNEDVNMEGTDSKGTITKTSWFRSPFWFWKRCNREEERN